MQYSKKNVMRNAWKIRRANKVSMSTALKAAWALEKALVSAEEISSEILENNRVKVNDWNKYGKSRTYISVRVYTNAWNLKREIKLGYVDMMTGAYVAA